MPSQQKAVAALRLAHDQLRHGKLAPSPQLVGPMLANSWRRSLAAGLAPIGHLPDAEHLSSFQLARAVERQQELVAHARPVMEFLYAHTRNSDSMVLLADDHGVVLQVFGDSTFINRAQRVALMPGVSWHECHRGTNAIGTALAEGRPITVHGAQHFLERNAILTCAAAPVMAPDGRVLGVLDISGSQRDYHPHTMCLIRTAAQMVENRLFDAHFGGSLRFRFHPLAEGIGTLAEGVVALSDEGWIAGANSAGLQLLGISAEELGVTPLSRVLRLRIEELSDWSRRCPGEPMLVERDDGERLFLKVEPARKARAVAVSRTMAKPQDALAALDAGDECIAATIDRARKVLGKPIAILLQGESGVGKGTFAKAMHASGARADGPFVSFNCAGVAPDRIEAELFGKARSTGSSGGLVSEAQGGMLYIAEVGDLPPAAQTRLLRVLGERRLAPATRGTPMPIDFTLVCATRADLAADVAAGRFSADLYYRINGLLMQLPPLRKRQDFSSLLARLLREIAPPGIVLDPALAAAFAEHDWPGNLRQLINALTAACALLEAGDTRIGWQHLPDDLAAALRRPQRGGQESIGDTTDNLREISAAALSRAIKASHGNMSEAARRLGISRNTLYRRLHNAAASEEKEPAGW